MVSSIDDTVYEYIDGTITTYLGGRRRVGLAWAVGCLQATDPAMIRRVFEDRRAFYESTYDRGRLDALVDRLRGLGTLSP